jgi:hypothetical protein
LLALTEKENAKDTENTKPAASPWTPEAVKDIIRLFDSLAKDYLQFRREDSEAKLKRLETVTRHNRHLIYWMVGFLTVITASMGVLSYFGKVSSDALLFLVGTITGYLILMVQQFAESPVEMAEEIPST